MAAMDGTTFEGTFNSPSVGKFKDNTSNAIVEQFMRDLVTAIKESYLNRTDDLIDEDDMASDSAVKVPSQQSVKAFVEAFVYNATKLKVVDAATTANITLSGVQTIDGQAGFDNMVVLVKDQTDQKENGLYLMASGSWARQTGATTGGQLQGMEVNVMKGSTNADTKWNQITDNVTVGSSNIVFQEFTTGAAINRTWTETLLFDKKEISFAPIVQSSPIAYELAADGHLVNSFCAAVQTVTADGINPVSFGAGFDFIYGIQNGQILDAGTYQFYFLYLNGSVTVNVPGVSAQASSGTVLSAPGSFAAVADGENDIDLSWANVTNNSGYQVEYSSNGTSGWNVLEVTAADATSSTHSGLSPGQVVYYRIKTLGDGGTFLTSAYSSVVSGQTESSGDVTAPTFTFLPASGNTDWAVNRPITITANEPIRNTNGTDLTDANIAAVLTLKQTNSVGANISFTATIDGTKQIITIYPSPQYGTTQLVYVAINNVEDVNGNEVTVAISSTFTTNDYTNFDGASDRLQFGDILDSLFAANDAEFWLGATVKDIPLVGVRTLWAKSSSTENQRGFYWYLNGTDVYFGWFSLVTGRPRLVKWSNVMAGHDDAVLLVKYNGAIDTNDGLDRCTFLINGVTVGAKTLNSSEGALANIANSTAPLSFGVALDSSNVPIGTGFYLKEVKDLMIWSNNGAIVEINIPNPVTGIDTSGNSRNGTWV